MGTINGGENWFRIFSLPAVMVGDVEFGADGTTVIATVFRDNQVANGGGIYVSHNRGGTWSRPVTGVVPPTPFITRTSAYGVSRSPESRVSGTSARTSAWRSVRQRRHVDAQSARADVPTMVQAVLAFPQARCWLSLKRALPQRRSGRHMAQSAHGLLRQDSDTASTRWTARPTRPGPLREYHSGR